MVLDTLDKKQLYLTRRLLLRWRQWLFIVIPIALIPILIFTRMSKEGRGTYGVSVVICYWIFSLLPLPITGLLPVFLMPLLGIVDSKTICKEYMVDTNMLLLTSMMAAVGIEFSQLHRRIALKTLIILGTAPRWLLLGFMLPSMFLSMWINNTSACALMVPIADVVLLEIYPDEELLSPVTAEITRSAESGSDIKISIKESQLSAGYYKEKRNTRAAVMVSIAYACNIGGTGTLTGTAPNLVLIGFMERTYDHIYIPNYLSWMLFNVPAMILCVFISWIVLQAYFWGPKSIFKWQRKRRSVAESNAVIALKIRYAELGKLKYHEITILILFIALVILWVFRSPGFMPGWKIFFYEDVPISDSAPAALIVALMFILPSQKDCFCRNLRDEQYDQPPSRTLNWKFVHLNVTWSILLLIGGGFALAYAIKESGVSTYIAQQLFFMKELPISVSVCLCMLITFLVTTVTSNAATVTILLPILIELAESIKLGVMYLILPTTIACSWAFMLPISTPPNAIAFERGRMNTTDMLFPGFILGVLFTFLMLFLMTFIAPLIFHMEYIPPKES